ncbi:MAG TPA: response regulator transcription factor [Bryobacteraceae bacterium]|nr:response regulator transcription factor [Bryobacteraceae bacterium]
MTAATDAAIRVLLVEDQREIREGLAALIDGTTGFRCCGAYGTMEQALARLESDNPSLALIDIDLPGMSGIDGIRLLAERRPTVHPLILTIHDDDDRILKALCAGANGYLLKGIAPARLLDCLKEAANGGAPMSPEVARRVINVFRQIRPPERAAYGLTPHEMKILQMLVSGENYKTAAAKLGVTAHAVSFHVRRIYEKLHVHSRTEAVAKALRSGLFH